MRIGLEVDGEGGQGGLGVHTSAAEQIGSHDGWSGSQPAGWARAKAIGIEGFLSGGVYLRVRWRVILEGETSLVERWNDDGERGTRGA